MSFVPKKAFFQWKTYQSRFPQETSRHTRYFRLISVLFYLGVSVETMNIPRNVLSKLYSPLLPTSRAQAGPEECSINKA